MSSPAPPVSGARLELLRALGFGELQHDSHVPFLSHLIGTRRLLVEWGARPELCDAGLFHSVYGTEYFVPERTPTRETVQALIGTDAERTAWLWCSIRRETMDPTGGSVRLRASDESEPLTRREVGDLATLWAADTVEQVARLEPHERGFAAGLLAVLSEAGEQARAAVATVRSYL